MASKDRKYVRLREQVASLAASQGAVNLARDFFIYDAVEDDFEQVRRDFELWQNGGKWLSEWDGSVAIFSDYCIRDSLIPSGKARPNTLFVCAPQAMYSHEQEAAVKQLKCDYDIIYDWTEDDGALRWAAACGEIYDSHVSNMCGAERVFGILPLNGKYLDGKYDEYPGGYCEYVSALLEVLHWDKAEDIRTAFRRTSFILEYILNTDGHFRWVPDDSKPVLSYNTEEARSRGDFLMRYGDESYQTFSSVMTLDELRQCLIEKVDNCGGYDALAAYDNGVPVSDILVGEHWFKKAWRMKSSLFR